MADAPLHYGSWAALPRDLSDIRTRREAELLAYWYAPTDTLRTRSLFRDFTFPDGEIEIVLWQSGCGASAAALLDLAREQGAEDSIKHLTIIEPCSPLADFVADYMRRKAPGALVTHLHASLPATGRWPVVEHFTAKAGTVIHLFSASLCHPDIKQNQLAKIIASSAREVFVVIHSPLNDLSHRIGEFAAHFPDSEVITDISTPRLGYLSPQLPLSCCGKLLRLTSRTAAVTEQLPAAEDVTASSAGHPDFPIGAQIKDAALPPQALSICQFLNRLAQGELTILLRPRIGLETPDLLLLRRNAAPLLIMIGDTNSFPSSRATLRASASLLQSLLAQEGLPGTIRMLHISTDNSANPPESITLDQLFAKRTINEILPPTAAKLPPNVVELIAPPHRKGRLVPDKELPRRSICRAPYGAGLTYNLVLEAAASLPIFQRRVLILLPSASLLPSVRHCLKHIDCDFEPAALAVMTCAELAAQTALSNPQQTFAEQQDCAADVQALYSAMPRNRFDRIFVDEADLLSPEELEDLYLRYLSPGGEIALFTHSADFLKDAEGWVQRELAEPRSRFNSEALTGFLASLEMQDTDGDRLSIQSLNPGLPPDRLAGECLRQMDEKQWRPDHTVILSDNVKLLRDMHRAIEQSRRIYNSAANKRQPRTTGLTESELIARRKYNPSFTDDGAKNRFKCYFPSVPVHTLFIPADELIALSARAALDKTKLKSLSLMRQKSFRPDQHAEALLMAHISHFRGLERPNVILILDRPLPADELMRAASRASERLMILRRYPEAEAPRSEN